MTAPAVELQGALFAALSQDTALVTLLGGAKIFDAVPAGTAFPYVTFGRTSVYDWSTGTELGTEHLLTLHVWSREKGRKEAAEIMEAVRARLENAALPMNGHHLVNLRPEFSELRHSEDLALHHGLLRYRAVVERVEP